MIRFFLSLLTLSLILTGCTSAPPPNRTIEVSGTATIKVVPDEMNWSVAVTINDKTLAFAKSRHDASLKSLQAYLQGLGAAIADLQTGGIRFDKNYYATKDQPPYTCSTDLTFTLKDFDKYGEICDQLASLDGVQVGGTDYNYSKAIETKKEARKQALLAAQEKAQEMASALGCSVGRPLTISEQGSYTAPLNRMVANVAFAAAPGGTPAPVAGQVEINSQVQVTFDLIP